MSFLENPFNPMATFETQAALSSAANLDPKLSRTHYYDGRLLKASDLVRDQFYLDERLNEVGRVLGQGVVRGLQVLFSLKDGLTIQKGLAIAPSGRVLELEDDIPNLRLTDDALINTNNPNYRSLASGLYALVIRYAQKGVGSAEVFPKDLESQRGFHFNAYEEGVEFALQKLTQSLPLEQLQQMPADEVSLYARAQLVRPLLINNPGQPIGLDENCVALGLLAVERGIPQWFDQGLLRRPFRSAQALNYMQIDLYNHYEELLRALLEQREHLVSNRDKFLAERYFSVLPPVGAIPKGALDPVSGYQHFFPASYEVSISPLREDDVAAVVQQSMALEPIDLQRDKDVDIMIAVVLDDLDFAFVARQLQHLDADKKASAQPPQVDTDITGSAQPSPVVEKKEFVHPPHLDEFFLGSVSLNSAASGKPSPWENIWAKTRRVFYVRRPIRVAETQVSAIVLATGEYEDLENSSAFQLQIATLNADATKNAADLANAKSEKETALAAGNLLKTQIDTLNAELERLRADIAQQETALANALSEKETALAAGNLLKTEIDTLNAELERLRTDIAQQETALANALSEKETALAAGDLLKTQIDTLNAELERLRTDIAQQETALANALSEKETALAAGDLLKTQIDTLNAELERLRTDIARQETALANALSEKETALAAGDLLKTQIDTLNAELERLRTDIAQQETALTNTINEKNTALASADLLKTEIDTLKAELENVSAELKDLQENSASSAELEAVNQQLAATQIELGNAQKKLANNQAQVQGAQLETHQLQRFMVAMLEQQQIKWESLDLLTNLRSPDDAEAQSVMKKLLEALSQDSDNQQLLVQLLTLMPAHHDSLNWPSLLFTFEQAQLKELREHLRTIEPANYLRSIVKFSEENGFPAELQAAWGKLLEQQQRRED